jgi:hypothetical protein
MLSERKKSVVAGTHALGSPGTSGFAYAESRLYCGVVEVVHLVNPNDRIGSDIGELIANAEQLAVSVK